MLILERDINESIFIDKNGIIIEIKYIYKRGRKIKIGISAPEEFNIYRGEHINKNDSMPTSFENDFNSYRDKHG